MVGEWVIGRPIHGITLNRLEYVYRGDKLAIFDSEEEARSYLYVNGYTDKDIEVEGIVFCNLKARMEDQDE